MAKKERTTFRGKVHKSMKKESKFGYLNLPDGVTQFKAEGGTQVQFDILPYIVTDEHHLDRSDEDQIATPGNLWWRKPIRVHKNVGHGNDKRTVICPTTVGKRCPICEYAKKRREDGADWEDELKHIVYKTRSLYIIVLRDASECEEKYKLGVPHIFDMSDHLFLKVLREELDRDIDHEVFPDLEDGLTLQVRFVEDHFGKQAFAKTSRIDFLKRSDIYPEEILEKLPSPDADMLKILSYKELDAMFHNMESEDVDVEEEDVDEVETIEEPVIERRRKPIVSEEEEAEEPAPTQPKRSRSAPPAAEPTEDGDRCPHGHTFGVDTDKHEICYECDIWDACSEAKEAKGEE
jgi:hypothetical protein